MPTPRPHAAPKRYFTVEQANKMLPLLRSIVRDIVESAADLQRQHEQLSRGGADDESDYYTEERLSLRREVERGAARIEELVDELRELGVELKGWDGLVDFPALLEGREVYLCWKYGEPEVAHWHEIDAGFAGRRKLTGKEAITDTLPRPVREKAGDTL